jgi:hypothetical protein
MVAEHARAHTTPQQTIAELERRYRFREPEEVRAFLLAHPEVLDLVVEAAAKIPEFLPIDEGIELEVVRDPEDEHDPGELFAIVPTRLEPVDVRPRMHRLLREWLVDAGRPFGLLFNVGVEYR